MKFRFGFLFVTLCLTLMSVSECEPFDSRIYCPISAEVNGVNYENDYVRPSEGVPYATFGSEGKNYYLNTSGRWLKSESGDSLMFRLKFNEEVDTSSFSLNVKYKMKALVRTGATSRESSDGWILFTSISGRLDGRFECVVRDDRTNEIVYDVRNGCFSLPYRW